jgi:hypothetical protein
MNRIPVGKQNERERDSRATDGDDELGTPIFHFFPA